MQGNKTRAMLAVAAVGVGGTLLATLTGAGTGIAATASDSHSAATPIRHLVVIFQENVSFDHYFGTYPSAANTDGQPFHAAPGTPSIDGLTPSLLTNNPNGVNPQRYDANDVNDLLTCDQDHDYNDEQQAFDGGAMDKFPATVGTASGTSNTGQACRGADVMNYLRRQHRHGFVELRAALRDERQLLRHDLRPVVTGRDQPRLG